MSPLFKLFDLVLKNMWNEGLSFFEGDWSEGLKRDNGGTLEHFFMKLVIQRKLSVKSVDCRD